MSAEDAYQYFVLRAQEIAISKNWTPVNWYDLPIFIAVFHPKQKHATDRVFHPREETFNVFATKLNPKTVVHNW